jgi:NAD+ synthase (glutamine-hydrolysing)
MGTKNSSTETRQRAKDLAEKIGAFHYDATIDEMIDGMTNMFSKIAGKTP